MALNFSCVCRELASLSSALRSADATCCLSWAMSDCEEESRSVADESCASSLLLWSWRKGDINYCVVLTAKVPSHPSSLTPHPPPSPSPLPFLPLTFSFLRVSSNVLMRRLRWSNSRCKAAI